MTTENPYLPCPFCGSADIDPEHWWSDDVTHGPGCDQCGATGEADGWNRRALDVERLVEALCQIMQPADILLVEDEALRLAYSNAYIEPLSRADMKPAGIRALVLAALGVEPATEEAA